LKPLTKIDKELLMFQNANWYMEVSTNIAQGIGAHTHPKIETYLEGIEGLEGRDIAFIQIGYAFAPDPLTTKSFIERGPYTNPASLNEQMDASVERGWLKPAGKGHYQLSDKGKQFAEEFFGLWNEWFGSLPTLAEDETERAAQLLSKLVKAAYQLPKPDKKPTLEIGVRLRPEADAPAMLRVRRHITDLAYYRDDAHIAAWQPYNVSGKVWETLTFLWNGEAATSDEMVEQVGEYRHYDASDYAEAFEELIARGWATSENGKHHITDKGKEIRQEAENVTDQLFYAPFESLTQEETKELKRVLERLAEVVRPPETEAEPA
jgi:DNA-binding MarR family transcriptional regulator